MRILNLFLVISLNCSAQYSGDSSRLTIFKTVISILAHDSLQGRGVGTEFEQKSLEFVAAKFHELTGRKCKNQSFNVQLDSSKVQSNNGYYFLNNRKDETIIIGAHYDHIGLGGPLSMSRKNNHIHNGADDNASGVAMLLALSNELIGAQNLNYNILFVFYGAHEVGLFGSSEFHRFVNKKKRKFKRIGLVINFDMIGRFDEMSKKLKCMGSDNAQKFIQDLDSKQFGLELNVTEAEKLLSLDTKAFVIQDIPCLNFTTGMHNDYHAISDDSQYINYHGMLQIYSYLSALILQF